MSHFQAQSDYQEIKNPCFVCGDESLYYHPNYAKTYCWKHWPEEGIKSHWGGKIPEGESIFLCAYQNCQIRIYSTWIYCNKHCKLVFGEK